MRANGNGNPKICAENLLKCTRGEVPYERVKGLDPRLIDRPFAEARTATQQDAAWLLETYEPRAVVGAIEVMPDGTAAGGFSITANITEKEE